MPSEDKLKLVRYQVTVGLQSKLIQADPLKLLENPSFRQVLARELKDLKPEEQKEVAKKVIEEEVAKLKK